MANEMRLIDADALFNNLADYWGIPKDWDGRIHRICDDALSTIENFPTVDAVEVVHGRWMPTYHTYYNRDGEYQIADEFHCSKCGIYSRDEWHFCPNCGAKMDGGN